MKYYYLTNQCRGNCASCEKNCASCEKNCAPCKKNCTSPKKLFFKDNYFPFKENQLERWGIYSILLFMDFAPKSLHFPRFLLLLQRRKETAPRHDIQANLIILLRELKKHLQFQ